MFNIKLVERIMKEEKTMRVLLLLVNMNNVDKSKSKR